MQVWGGHGYIRDNGMEQNLRDARIGTMYEGTTGIQSLDLLGRKVIPQLMQVGQPLPSLVIPLTSTFLVVFSIFSVFLL